MRRLRRTQLLSIAIVLGLVVVLVVLGFFHKTMASRQLLELGESSNLSLSQTVLNTLWDDMETLVHVPVKGSFVVNREIHTIHQKILEHVHALPLYKVKIYNLDGITVFSTDSTQIGEDQKRNQGVSQAMGGEIISEIIYKSADPSLDGQVEERALIASYIPLRSNSQATIQGVFEFYHDVSHLLARAKKAQWLAAITLAGILLPLISILLFVIYRLDRTVRDSHSSRRRFVEGIEQANADLELRIQERTQELTTTNLALQTEVIVRRNAESELSLAANIYQNTSEGIVVTDDHGVIQSVNSVFSDVTGFSSEDVVGKPMGILRSDRHDAEFYQNVWMTLRTDGKWRGEVWNQRKNGEIFPELVHISAIRGGGGHVQHYVAVFTDLSGIKKAEEKIQFLAHYDTMTGLPNRTLLLDRMQRAFSYAQRFEQMVAVLFLGLDRFKSTNELIGRTMGDQLLRDVGIRITSTLREEDSLARMGGDEFVILATGLLDVNNAGKIAQKILDSFSDPFMVGGEPFYLGASIGISVHPYDQGDAHQYIKNAESAMSQVKARGGAGTQFYTQEMGAVSIKRLAIEKGLRHALERDELFLTYQPQIDVASGRMVGVEALIRWRSPELGLVSPVNFIPLAEESNLIVSIGEWVLRTACSQAVAWQAEGFAPIRVAVNLSARQFQHPGLLETVDKALVDTGLDPNYLELELTEGMFMSDIQGTVTLLKKMKNKGLQLSIDDFGTGYSSLSYLKRFPIHTLKIDRAFIRDITEDPDDAAITRTIIAMAKNLNLHVVAEGVASVEQLEYLRTLGCDMVQGFLFSQPVLPDEIALFLEEDQNIRQSFPNDQTVFSKLLSENGKVIPFPNRSGPEVASLENTQTKKHSV